MGKAKKRKGFSWWGDWSFVWIIGGFGVAYLAFVPLEAHPLHWLYSFLGAVAGYGMSLLFEVWFPRLRGRVVRRRPGAAATKRTRQGRRRGR